MSIVYCQWLYRGKNSPKKKLLVVLSDAVILQHMNTQINKHWWWHTNLSRGL
jgi:hypothetical protein